MKPGDMGVSDLASELARYHSRGDMVFKCGRNMPLWVYRNIELHADPDQWPLPDNVLYHLVDASGFVSVEPGLLLRDLPNCAGTPDNYDDDPPRPASLRGDD